ncbi:uroporphyrinogen-III synthase, partial [Staphylococcus aureus]|nr:uroporphyrinogen-III synthase [Staphylococcus aureus]
MNPFVVMTQTIDMLSDLVSIIHKPFIDIKQINFDIHLLNLRYDCLIFSYKYAVIFFYIYLKGINFDNIAVIGSKTSQYCESLG